MGWQRYSQHSVVEKTPEAKEDPVAAGEDPAEEEALVELETMADKEQAVRVGLPVDQVIL